MFEADVILGEGKNVEVKVESCTFGPHTRNFGLRYYISLREADRPKFTQHVATYHIGRGGNNSRRRGLFQMVLPTGFSAMAVVEQVKILENGARRNGIDLNYDKRSSTLQASGITCDVFRTYRRDGPGPQFVCRVSGDGFITSYVATHERRA
jgi:hypothetical protein